MCRSDDLKTDATLRSPYYDYGEWIRKRFPFKVQKLPIDGGFSCPNRDGRIGRGGCSFCDNRTFIPRYCQPERSVRQQIKDGKRFFGRKYPDMRYMAYFQSFTNTYAPLDHLKRLYGEALACDDIVGIAIGTRPDCISSALLDYLEQLARQTMVVVEYGVESANDDTLKRINRGHDFDCSRKAIEATHERGITTAAHLILGLPGEPFDELMRQADLIGQLPVDLLKFHQLQIVSGTRMEQVYRQGGVEPLTLEGYMHLLAHYLMRLPPQIAIERLASQSPGELLVAPRWGIKPHELARRLTAYMNAQGYWQGKMAEKQGEER